MVLMPRWLVLVLLVLPLFFHLGVGQVSIIDVSPASQGSDPAPIVQVDPLLMDYEPTSDMSIPREFFAKFNESPSETHIGYLEEKYGLFALQHFPSISSVLFKSGGQVPAFMADQEPTIDSLWSNRKLSLPRDGLVSNVSQLPFVDFNTEVRSNALKKQGFNGTSVTIAFLDTGVDITGQVGGGDLDDFDDNSSTSDYKFYGAVSVVPDDGFYYSDFSGRGTWHASLTTGTGYYNQSYEGVAPGSKYLSVKIYDPLGLTTYQAIISGISWAVRNNADIIVLSADIPGVPGDPVSLAINDAVDRGVLVVTPAGNEGSSYMSISSPGHATKALTVGAYDSFTGSVAHFSSRGPSLDFRTSVNIIAPGVGLVGTKATVVPPTNSSSINSLFSEPRFGTTYDVNYTRASGTGGAAAVVAGVCALLLQAFPQVTPEVLMVALMNTAVPLEGENPNTQGAGLIDAVSTYNYLSTYFSQRTVDIFPITAQSLFTGTVDNVDNLEVSQSDERPDDWQALDLRSTYTTHGVALALLTNQTDFNVSSAHLILSSFGVGYNGTFQWLALMEVLKELRQVTSEPIGESSYQRYSGVLANDDVYVVPTVESWAYCSDQNNRVTALRLGFVVINVGRGELANVTFGGVMKTDLYLSEANVTLEGSSPWQGLGNQSYALDDSLEHMNIANGTDLLVAVDEVAGPTLNASAYNVTALGLSSPHKNMSSWEIGEFVSMFRNLTEAGTLQNSHTSQPGQDQSWGFLFELTTSLAPNNHTNATLDLGLGMGYNTSQAMDHLTKTLTLIKTNVTTPEILDLVVINSDFRRITYTQELLYTSTEVINVGTRTVNETQVIFLVNRTNQLDRFELFGVVQTYDRLKLFEVQHISAEWLPIYPDFYTIAWAALVTEGTDVSELSQVNGTTDDTSTQVLSSFYASALSSYSSVLLASFQTRNTVVLERATLNNVTSKVAFVNPSKLVCPPQTPQFPGDIAFWNLTLFTATNLTSVSLEITGVGSQWFDLNQSYFNELSPFTTLYVVLSVPLLSGPGLYKPVLSVNYQGSLLVEVPIQFTIYPTHGRVFFDAIHNNITVGLDATGGISFEWDERLDTTFGNYYDLSRVWFSGGTAVQQLVSGINVNLTDMGLTDLSSDTHFLPDTMKGLSFEGETISTDYIDPNLLQFGDVLVLNDPEISFSPKEIETVADFVERGGTLIFLVEPSNENNWTAVDEMLYPFGLAINDSSAGPTNLTHHVSQFNNLSLDIIMNDPVTFMASQSSNLTMDYHSDSFVLARFGRGKIAVLGDKDLVNNTGLTLADNRLLASQLLRWSLERSAELEVVVSSYEVKQGGHVYFDVEVQNIANLEPFLEEGFIFVSSFTTEEGEVVRSVEENNFTILPMWQSRRGHYHTSFDTSWLSSNTSQTIYAIFYFEHPAITGEIFFVDVQVSSEQVIIWPANTLPTIPYPHETDLLLLVAIVGIFFLQRLYHSYKWSRRFRIRQLSDEDKFKLETQLNELKMLTENLNETLRSTNPSIQKVRIILKLRRKLQKSIKEIKEFSEYIGEV